MLETLGAVGAVVGILDVVARSVLRLRDMQKRLKEANVNVQMMMGELTATRTALKVLKAGIASSTDKALDEELSAGLDSSLESCSLLVQIIDGKISSVPPTLAGPQLLERFQIVLTDKETTDLFSRLGRMLDALKIITEGLERPNTIEQAAFIHDICNHNAISSMKDDTSSLIALYDVDSTRSRHTSISSSTSKLSLRLPGLDEFLLQRKPYQNAFRHLLRRSRSDRSREYKTRSQWHLESLPIVNVKISLNSNLLLCQMIFDALNVLVGHTTTTIQTPDMVDKCRGERRDVGIEGLGVWTVCTRGCRVNIGPAVSTSTTNLLEENVTILLHVINCSDACDADRLINVDMLVESLREAVTLLKLSAVTAGVFVIHTGMMRKDPKQLNGYSRPDAWFLEEVCRKFRMTYAMDLGRSSTTKYYVHILDTVTDMTATLCDILDIAGNVIGEQPRYSLRTRRITREEFFAT
ncbi:MAG: hypothetical protein Q9162_001482 [Coniocarpon cinnabarinum]